MRQRRRICPVRVVGIVPKLPRGEPPLHLGHFRERRRLISRPTFTLRAEIRPFQRVQMRQTTILEHRLETFGGAIEFVSQQRHERRCTV